jgi:hypothetical protein
MRRGVAAFAILLAACKGAGNAAPSGDAAGASAGAGAGAGAGASASAGAGAGASATPSAASTAAVPLPLDAGACLLLQGPSQQPFRGAGALGASDPGVDVVFNDSGAARVAHVAPATHASLDRAAQPPAVASSLPCAVAGDAVFCADPSGAVHRATRSGGGGAVVAQAIPGTRLDAVVLGGKPLVAYLVQKKTEEEGQRSMVEGLADGAVRVSLAAEGATSFVLVPTDAGAMIVTVDARTALTSVRAAPIQSGTPPTVGDGAVIFVGGPPAGTDLVADVATSNNGARVVLLPISKDFSTFAMAGILLEDPPRADEPTAWSEYPNGMPRAPVAATRGTAKMTVARLRPLAAATGSPRVLEIGRVDEHGAFASLGLVATRGEPTDVAVRDAGGGAFWLLYTDAEGSWLERRRCP